MLLRQKYRLTQSRLLLLLNHNHRTSSSCNPHNTIRRSAFLNRSITTTSTRYLSSSPSPAPQSKADLKELQGKLATTYTNNRAAYKRAVGQLRKQYADEVAKQRISDEREEAELRAKQTRKRLERQRKKNIRSVKNSLRHEQERQRRAKEFQEELRVAQINRDARNERFRKARKLLLDELEEEAVHWIATPKEVDDTFDSLSNEQELWTRPGGYVGAPMPEQDAQFWRYESHTWEVSRRYKTPRQKMLETFEENTYWDSNISNVHWNDERVQFQKELEEKARLRALIREKGRLALLLKQQQLMQDAHAHNNAVGLDGLPALPKPVPVPNLHVLSNYDAMDREGVKLLEKDPTQFFVFDNKDGLGNDPDVPSDEMMGENTERSSLGKPIRVLDPLRDFSPTGTPWPELLGRPDRPDTRTQKEKKRQEREERLWAAAAADEAQDEMENAGEEDLPTLNDPVDYDKMANTVGDDDLKWEEQLDPVKDAELLDSLPHERLNEDDMKWLMGKIEKKINSLNEIVQREEIALGGENSIGKNLTISNDVGKDSHYELDDVQKALGGNVSRSTNTNERGQTHTSYEVLDYDHQRFKAERALNRIDDSSVLETLSDEQINAISELDSDGAGEVRSAQEIKEALNKVPGLSEEQVTALVELELSLLEHLDDDNH